MLHRDCGGKLVVIDSAQKEVDNDVVVYRTRRCEKCKKRINSFEVVEDGAIQSGYVHTSILTQDGIF